MEHEVRAGQRSIDERCFEQALVAPLSLNGRTQANMELSQLLFINA